MTGSSTPIDPVAPNDPFVLKGGKGDKGDPGPPTFTLPDAFAQAAGIVVDKVSFTIGVDFGTTSDKVLGGQHIGAAGGVAGLDDNELLSPTNLPAATSSAAGAVKADVANGALMRDGNGVVSTLDLAHVNPTTNGGFTAFPNGFTAGVYPGLPEWQRLGNVLGKFFANRNCLSGTAVNNLAPGSSNQMTGVTGVGVVQQGSAGNNAFGIYGNNDWFDIGAGKSGEVDTHNWAGPPTPLLPARVAGHKPIGFTSSAGGIFGSSIGYSCSFPTNTPSYYLTGVYLNPGAVTVNGLYVDATVGDGGPLNGAVIKGVYPAVTPSNSGTTTLTTVGSTLDNDASQCILKFADVSGLALGMPVTGTSIPSGTTVADLYAPTFLILPQDTITDILVGDTISGTNIPAGTTVSSVGRSYVIMSAPATGLIAAGTAITFGGTKVHNLYADTCALCVISQGVSANISSGASITFGQKPYGTGITVKALSAFTRGDGNTVADNSQSPAFQIVGSSGASFLTLTLDGSIVFSGGITKNGVQKVNNPASGSTVPINSWAPLVILNPNATTAALTLELPPNPPGSGKTIRISTTKAITALTLTTTDGSAVDASLPTTLAAGQAFEVAYFNAPAHWFPG